MKYFRLLLLFALSIAGLTACQKETPDESYVSFISSSYNIDEDNGETMIQVVLNNTPESYPVTVDIEVEQVSEGNLDDIVKFTQLTGIELTPENKGVVTFEVLDNDELNETSFVFNLKIVKANGISIGEKDETEISIVDNEYAPALYCTDHYDIEYTSATETALNEDGFELTLRKVGKYQYAAYGWFGVNQPLLLGTFDPETQRLTFDGTIYYTEVDDDEEVPADRIENAFGSAFYFNNIERTEVLVFNGAGDNGKGAIIFDTDEVEMNKRGVIKTALSDCNIELYNCTVNDKGAVTVGTLKGYYGYMPAAATAKYTGEMAEDYDPSIPPFSSAMQMRSAQSTTLIPLANPVTVK